VAEETFAERLWEGIDEALAPYDVPSEFGEILKSDLKTAFDIKAKARPGYEPGAVAFTKFNLIDAITKPLETTRETIASIFENRGRPPIPLLWTDAESAVWEHYFTVAGLDPRGGPAVPYSLQQATLRWNERARLRITRLIAEEKGIQQSPGLTLMMARQLNTYYASLPGAPAPIVGGVMLPQIIAQAEGFERGIVDRLAIGDWEGAGEIQTDWFKASKTSRDAVRKEFERVSRLGEAGISSAAQQLATSPEGVFWRYWKNRNLYFQTLNFLNTYHEKGFWGTVKVYIWQEFIKRAFATGTWRYYLYPKNLIRGAVGWTAERVRLTALLNKITEAKALFARVWKRFIKDPLTKGFEFVRDKVIRRIAGWIAARLGLAGISTAIGTAVGGPVGAILGAVVSFVGGLVAEKMMKPVLTLAIYLFVGICGFFVLAIGGMAIFLIFLMGSIFNTNAALPSAITSVPITVTKEACEPAPSCDEFDNPLQIEKDGLVHPIRWRITIKNTGEAGEQINWGDDYCQPGGDPSGFPIPIGPGGEITAFCNQNITANEDKVVTNTVRGTTTPATAPFSGTGAVIVGEPSTAYPIGWPLASGYITQGPNAPYSHTGDEAIDIDYSNAGNPVLATHSGVVVSHCYSVSGCTAGYGNYVRVRSSAGFETVFAHLDNVYVRTGDPVFFGQPVGTVGNTGNSDGFHLHYEFFGLEMAPPYIPQEVPPCVSRSVCDIHW